MARTEPKDRLATAIGLWIAQAAVAGLACGQVFLSALSIASCTETSCDYELHSAAIGAFTVGAAVCVVAALGAIYLLRKHPHAVLWPPVIGMAGIVLLLCVSYALSRAALDLPLFGGRPA